MAAVQDKIASLRFWGCGGLWVGLFVSLDEQKGSKMPAYIYIFHVADHQMTLYYKMTRNTTEKKDALHKAPDQFHPSCK